MYLQLNMPAFLCPWPLLIAGVSLSTSLYQQILEKFTVLTNQIIHTLKISLLRYVIYGVST